MRLPTSSRAAGLNRQRGIWRSALEAASEGVLLRISRDLLAARVVNVDRQRQANRLMQMCNDPAARRLAHGIDRQHAALSIVERGARFLAGRTGADQDRTAGEEP